MEEIKNYYNCLMANNPQFAKFVEENQNIPTNEMIKKFDINVEKEQTI